MPTDLLTQENNGIWQKIYQQEEGLLFNLKFLMCQYPNFLGCYSKLLCVSLGLSSSSKHSQWFNHHWLPSYPSLPLSCDEGQHLWYTILCYSYTLVNTPTSILSTSLRSLPILFPKIYHNKGPPVAKWSCINSMYEQSSGSILVAWYEPDEEGIIFLYWLK